MPGDPESANPAVQDFWSELRTTTQARIGLGRVGNSLPTRNVLELSAAHAAARDAVHEPLDVETLAAAVTRIGIGEPAVVSSRASTRGEYLRRPDFGRLPAEQTALPETPADIGFVLADGLSPLALAKHGAPLLAELVARLAPHYTLAPPVIATQARVALGDHIGARAGFTTLLVIIGERPGLSVADSLGIYLTHRPRVGHGYKLGAKGRMELQPCAIALRTIETLPGRVTELGDPWAGLLDGDDGATIEPFLAWSDRDLAAGLGDAPWPPVYPKMPGEPPRVAPSRAKKS